MINPIENKHIPAPFLDKWQGVIQSAASEFDMGAAVIARAMPGYFKVLVTGQAPGKPFVPGQRIPRIRQSLFEGILSSQATMVRETGALPEYGMVSLIGAPLVWPDRSAFGFFCLMDARPRVFATSRVGLFNHLKGIFEGDFRVLHYSRVLNDHKSRLEETVDQQTVELRRAKQRVESELAQKIETEKKLSWELNVNSALAKLSTSLVSSGQSIKNRALEVSKWARSLTGSAHCFVSEIDRKTGDNIGHTLSEMRGEACRVLEAQYRIRFPKDSDGTYGGLWGHALNTGAPFFTNDPANHPGSGRLPEGHIPIKKFLSVPVIYAGTLVGQIALANPGGEYEEKHLEAVQRLADLFALAVNRHREEEDRRTLESRLQQAQKMEAIGNLAGGIAHDFNNILFPIIGMSELLIEDLLPGSQEQLNAREILTAGLRGSELVKQILAFSRRDGHDIVPVKIQSVLREVLRLCRSSIPSDIEITAHIREACGPVNAAPTQIHQVAMNLITNAYHAVEDKGGTIALLLKEALLSPGDLPGSPLEPGRYAQLSVSDTGCGIDPGIQDKIFDPYFTTKAQGKGTGLGLATVYGIVKGYHGDIRVYSEPGEGSTFSIYLPVLDTHPEPESEATECAFRGGTERILLVDDEDAILKLETTMLERLGYRVTPFKSSPEALAHFNADPWAYDLVVTDMTMPRMTGDLFSRELKRTRPDIPILICTGFSERANTEQAKALGIGGFLMKPVARSELSEKIRHILDQTQLPG